MRACNFWAWCVVTGALFASVSCGSSDAGNAADNACVEQWITAQAGPAHLACLKQHCASNLAALESGCSAAFSCLCPGGTFDADAGTSMTCAQAADQPACQSAVMMTCPAC